jgi:enamine deaminase RidA (YjgF/YER057c/UK114 family)
VLIEDRNSFILVDRYSRFTASLVRYQILCFGRLGREKADYLEGFYELKQNTDNLFKIMGNEVLSEEITRPVNNLLKNIQSILKKRLLTLKDIQRISLMITDFILKEEHNFKRKLFDEVISKLSEKKYSRELYEAVAPLLNSSKYDAAIAAAVKYLDVHLQKLLNISTYEANGEELINRAFSPNSVPFANRAHITGF